MGIAIAIIAIVLLGGIALLVITRRAGDGSGHLSRETVARDRAAATPAAEETPGTDVEAVETAEARARAQETRASAGGGGVVPRDAGTVAEWEPLDPEELSLSRRKFFNRAILTVGGLGFLPAF